MNNIDERTGEPKIILHLCAKMGSDSLPYKEAGYDVRIIGEDIGVENYNPPENVYGIIANPPCTMFSMARTKAKTPRDLREGMRLVKECLRVIWECQYRARKRTSHLFFWAMENPATGMLRQFLGKPSFEYSQSEYGEFRHKKTALWGMFNEPKRPLLYNSIPSGLTNNRNKIEIYKKWGNSENASRCPINFAKAFFESNQ